MDRRPTGRPTSRPASSSAGPPTTPPSTERSGVEWLNVTSGLDIAPDWTFGHVEMIREGAIWVGVTAQVTGIEGAPGPGEALALRGLDPVRYGPLDHPGDDFSYDLFSQVGAAVRAQPEVLGGLTPERVIALGESPVGQPTLHLRQRRGADGQRLRRLPAAQPGRWVGTTAHGHSRRAAGRFGVRRSHPLPHPHAHGSDGARDGRVVGDRRGGSRLGYRAANQPRHRPVPKLGDRRHGPPRRLRAGHRRSRRRHGPGDTAAFEALRNPPDTAYFGFVVCEEG